MIFKNSGFEEVRKYRYWDKDSRGLNIDGMIEDLSAAPGKLNYSQDLNNDHDRYSDTVNVRIPVIQIQENFQFGYRMVPTQPFYYRTKVSSIGIVEARWRPKCSNHLITGPVFR